MDWVRLVAVGLATVAATCVAIVVAHDLWERARTPEMREKVVLFNVSTVLTVTIGVATLYLALFALSLGVSYGLIPPSEFEHQIGRPAGFTEHVKLAGLGSAIGTVAGALGSVIESDLSVREAMYRGGTDRRVEA
jgi:hypothetical protein